MIPLSQRIRAWNKSRNEPARTPNGEQLENVPTVATKAVPLPKNGDPIANKQDTFDMTALKDVVHELDTTRPIRGDFCLNESPENPGPPSEEVFKRDTSGLSSTRNSHQNTSNKSLKPAPQQSGLHQSRWAEEGTCKKVHSSEAVKSSSEFISTSAVTVSSNSATTKTERAPLTTNLQLPSNPIKSASDARLVAPLGKPNTVADASQMAFKPDQGSEPIVPFHLIDAGSSHAMKKPINPVNEAVKIWMKKKNNPTNVQHSRAEPLQKQSEKPTLDQAHPVYETLSVEIERSQRSQNTLPTLASDSSPTTLPQQPISQVEASSGQQGTTSVQKKRRQKIIYRALETKPKAPVLPLFQIPESTKAFSKNWKTASNKEDLHLDQMQDSRSNDVEYIKAGSAVGGLDAMENDVPDNQSVTPLLSEGSLPTVHTGSFENVPTTPKHPAKHALADAVNSWSATRGAPSTANLRPQDGSSNVVTQIAHFTPSSQGDFDQRTERRLHFLNLEEARQKAAKSQNPSENSIEVQQTECETHVDPNAAAPISNSQSAMSHFQQDRSVVVHVTPATASDIASHESLPKQANLCTPEPRAPNLLTDRIKIWSKRTLSRSPGSQQSNPETKPHSGEEKGETGLSQSPTSSIRTVTSPKPEVFYNAPLGVPHQPMGAIVVQTPINAKLRPSIVESRDVMNTDKELIEMTGDHSVITEVPDPSKPSSEPVDTHDISQHSMFTGIRTDVDDRKMPSEPGANKKLPDPVGTHLISVSTPADSSRTLQFRSGSTDGYNDSVSRDSRHEMDTINLDSKFPRTVPESHASNNDTPPSEYSMTSLNKTLRADANPFTPSRTISVNSNDTEYHRNLLKDRSLGSSNETNESNQVEQLKHQVQYLTDRIEQMAIGIPTHLGVKAQPFGEETSEALADHNADEEQLQAKIEALIKSESIQNLIRASLLDTKLEAILQPQLKATIEMATSTKITAATDRLKHMINAQALSYNTQLSSLQLELEASLEAKMQRGLTDQALHLQSVFTSMMKMELLKVPLPPPPLQPGQIHTLVLEEVSGVCKSPAMLQSLQQLWASQIPKATPAPTTSPTSRNSGEGSAAYTDEVICWQCHDDFFSPSSMAQHLNLHDNGALERHALRCHGPCRHFGQDSRDFPLACPGCDRIFATVVALFQHLDSEKKICEESFHEGTGHIWGFMGQLRRRLRIDEAYMYGRKI